MKKNKKQKTTAWVLLGTGVAAILTGVIIDNSNKGNDQSYTGGFIEVGGVICTLTSIPFFISSSKNSRKAAAISFNYQKMLFQQQRSIVLKPQPALTLQVKL